MDQLFLGKPTDFDERVVAVGNHTLGIGGGNQSLLGRESPFALCDRLVVTHWYVVRKALRGCRHRQLLIEIILPGGITPASGR
jgi:hypothetical protein